MKSYARIISLILSLLLVLSLMTTAFAADGDFGDYDYDFTWDPDATDGDYTWDTDFSDNTEFVPEDDLALTTTFKDVKTTAWYYSDVTECAKLGIVAGFSDGTFKPDDKVTDVQFLVMMTRTFFNNKVEAVKAPAGSKWYYANIKVAEDTTLSYGLTVEDKAMNRYNMALVLYNELVLSGKKNNADSTKVNNAKNVFKDWDKMELKQKTYVKYCYALDILAGMADGTFSGNNSMTRAQACTVIMRMLKLVNNYNPGDKDNETYDDGKDQNASNNNQSKVTVEQALSILASIKSKYPTGTVWDGKGTNGNKYAAGVNSTDVKAVVTNKFKNAASNKYNTEITVGCGGWVAMVSDAIFGQTGAPAREVTDPSKVRPGDICVKLNANGQLKHVFIATSAPTYIDGEWRFDKCEGNVGGTDSYTGGTVNWESNATSLRSNANITIRAFTRYAD